MLHPVDNNNNYNTATQSRKAFGGGSTCWQSSSACEACHRLAGRWVLASVQVGRRVRGRAEWRRTTRPAPPPTSPSTHSDHQARSSAVAAGRTNERHCVQSALVKTAVSNRPISSLLHVCKTIDVKAHLMFISYSMFSLFRKRCCRLVLVMVN